MTGLICSGIPGRFAPDRVAGLTRNNQYAAVQLDEKRRLLEGKQVVRFKKEVK